MGEVIPFPRRHGANPLLTKRQLARALGKSVRWIEYRMAEGMPSILVAGRRRFREDDVRLWLSKHSPSDEGRKDGPERAA